MKPKNTCSTILAAERVNTNGAVNCRQQRSRFFDPIRVLMKTPAHLRDPGMTSFL